MTDAGSRRAAIALFASVIFLTGPSGSLVLDAQSPGLPAQTTANPGKALYEAACASCHGPDGRGAPPDAVGFDLALPDFTDCSFATSEPDADWLAIVRHGGPIRGFDRKMPAFGDALSLDEIARTISYIRAFCRDGAWPRGDLNLPRPLVTEKAFPENEAVVTTTIDGTGPEAIGNAFIYERRLGSRTQYEIVVPFNLHKGTATGWARGIGDIAIAAKRVLFHSLEHGAILSAGGEITFPTGKETQGLGDGVTTLEPFLTYSQMLPREGFLHAQAGVERTSDRDRKSSNAFWRTAAGWTFTQGGGAGRSWSPMVELLAARDLESGARTLWDLLPQMQVTLNRRGHIMASGGVQVPLTARDGRGKKLVVYLLWDWFDGGLFSGW
jgi:mono/diheme cytochrome c family protein